MVPTAVAASATNLMAVPTPDSTLYLRVGNFALSRRKQGFESPRERQRFQ